MVWLTKVLFAWLVCMVASRLIFNRVMRERWFVRRVLVLGSGTSPRAHPAIDQFRPWSVVRASIRCGNAGKVEFRRSALARRPPPAADLGNCRSLESATTSSLPTFPSGDCWTASYAEFRCSTRPGFSEQQLGRIDLDNVRTDWLLFAEGFANGRISNAIKRGLRHLGQLDPAAADSAVDVASRIADQAGKRGPIFTGRRASGCMASRSRCSNSAAWRRMPRKPASHGGQSSKIPGLLVSATSSGRCGSTNCPNCSTC